MTIANITWNFVPGSLSTLVEYRVSGTSTWTIPNIPTNPTPNNTYPIEIQDNIYYDIRLTTNGIACGPRSMTIQIVHPASNCCPPGYTLSQDGTFCFQVNTTAATPPSNPQNTVSKTLDVYSIYGTLIYDPGFNINGTGTFTQIPYSNTFWVNGPGYPNTSGSFVDGPLNRTGLWTLTSTPGQILGFTVCVTVPVSGIYYVGSGADNWTTIRVDGNVVLDMDIFAMDAYIAANGYPLADAVSFKFWNIYPIFLNAGNRVIEVIGVNESITPPPNPASVGIEIYNATSAELQLATSYVDLGSKLIFSTKDYIGQPVQVGNEGFGYTCPDGYSLVLCDGPAYCTQTLTTPTIPCTTTSTTTTTTTTL